MKERIYEKMVKKRRLWFHKILDRFIITQSTAKLNRRKILPFTKIGRRPRAKPIW